MNITTRDEGNTRILSLSGRLDTQTAPELEPPLLAAVEAAASVELDFSQLQYISSAGLRVLLGGQKAAAAQGKTLVLSGVQEDVREVFDLTGFSDFLTLR